MALVMVTDRTSADVAEAKRLSEAGGGKWTAEERENWMQGRAALGTYNIEDLNRVETATQFLSELWTTGRAEIVAYAESILVEWDSIFFPDYELPPMTHKTDWKREDLPTRAEMVRYLMNVALIKAIHTSIAGDLPATIAYLTHNGANEIEQVLQSADEVIPKLLEEARQKVTNTAEIFVYSGEIYGGEW